MGNPPFDIHNLLDPAVYPWPVDEVTLIETHISWVLLAGDRVVKLKKPVDLGFVDFRDPVTRKQACEDEVRLNRRLTTDLYLGVVPVTVDGVDAPGEPLEWATLMRRMPMDRMLDVLLAQGTAPVDLAERLAVRLIPFHATSLGRTKESSSRAKSRDLSLQEIRLPVGTHGEQEILRSAQNDEEEDDGSPHPQPLSLWGEGSERGELCPVDPEVYLSVLTDNLDQVAAAGGDIFGKEQLRLIDHSMRVFMEAERDWLADRFQYWLGEGHGDLRCEHICFEPDVMQIYDCVEFEIAIRCADIASDLAFLLMDLRRLGAQPVADELLERYRAAGFDLPSPVIALYAAHRALVRAKVAALARSGNDQERDLTHAFEAASYLDLASSFATPIAPLLVLVSGLSGSGKSTVAAAIGGATGGIVLASDRVRKELAGMEATESAAAAWHEGIYTAEWSARAYDRLLELTSAALDQQRSVIVDATLLDNHQRERFVAAARDRAMPVVILWTELDDAIARERIERRALVRNSTSDATFAIRDQQQKQLRDNPLRTPAGVIAVTIDTGRAGPASLDPFFTILREQHLLGVLQRNESASHV